MIVKKQEFIPQCLKILEKELMANLPDGPVYEYEMIEKAYQIIHDKIRHILGGG